MDSTIEREVQYNEFLYTEGKITEPTEIGNVYYIKFANIAQ